MESSWVVEERRCVVGDRVPGSSAAQGEPGGHPAPWRAARAGGRAAHALARPGRAGSRGLAIFGLDGLRRAQRPGRRHGGPVGLRGDRQRPGRPDGDQHALAALHAPVVPRPSSEAGARHVRRHPDVLLLAAQARGVGFGTEHRGHGRRVPRRRQSAAAAALSRSVHPSAASGGGRGARRRRRPPRARGIAGPADHGCGSCRPCHVEDAVHPAVDGRAGGAAGRYPGDRREGAHRGGSPSRLLPRPAPLGRRLRPRGRPVAGGLRGGAAGRGAPAAADVRPRARADHRAGPGLRPADPGRHRHPGALAGGERSDDRGPGARLHRRPPAGDRPARPAWPRRASGRAGSALCGRPGAPLGAVPPARRDRDPPVRRHLGPGHQAASCRAGGAAGRGGLLAPRRRGGGAVQARRHRRGERCRRRRSVVGGRPPPAAGAGPPPPPRQGIGGPPGQRLPASSHDAVRMPGL
jgi:hypothetical protein